MYFLCLDTNPEAPDLSKNICIEVQIWRYDPAPTARLNRVDPLSLILSFQNEGDERLQGQLENLIGEIDW